MIAVTAKYQSEPRTVIWLSVVTVLVKPLVSSAPLPILSKGMRIGLEIDLG